ncbi:DUF2130 domain-containing protein [Rudanella lutea]|uniref:DUF2130 domain-containing protein n=1 Tax=Rudanella lutea TaxID=451374 RepID=UPI00037949EB|nr:DUF2130 domain-containing protein [Rudanella lutea]
MNATLICPHCAETIDFESTLVHQIKHQLTHEQNQKLADQRRMLEQRAQELTEQAQKLNQQAAQQALTVQAQVQAGLNNLRQELKAQLQQEQATELSALQEELQEKTARIRNLQQQEVALRREQRNVQEMRDALELEVEKKLQAERKQLEEKARQRFEAENHLKIDEQQALINSLTLQLSEMKRRIEQGSQQAQGEVLEVAIEKLLADSFPFDQIGKHHFQIAVSNKRYQQNRLHVVPSPWKQNAGLGLV